MADPHQLSRGELIVLVEEQPLTWEQERKLLREENANLREENANLREENARLRQRCCRDFLTEAANRELLRTHLEMFRHLAKSDTGMFWSLLVLLDLDRFKGYNDTYGHPAGDKLLQFFTKELQVRLPKCDFYRLGGDEFAVTFAGNKEDVKKMARRAREKLWNGIPYHDGYVIRASAGIVTVCLDIFFDMEEMIKVADVRLYKAKAGSSRNGPGRKVDKILRPK